MPINSEGKNYRLPEVRKLNNFILEDRFNGLAGILLYKELELKETKKR